MCQVKFVQTSLSGVWLVRWAGENSFSTGVADIFSSKVRKLIGAGLVALAALQKSRVLRILGINHAAETLSLIWAAAGLAISMALLTNSVIRVRNCISTKIGTFLGSHKTNDIICAFFRNFGDPKVISALTATFFAFSTTNSTIFHTFFTCHFIPVTSRLIRILDKAFHQKVAKAGANTGIAIQIEVFHTCQALRSRGTRACKA